MRALGANHASRAPESGWPLPFHEVSGLGGLGGLGGFDCSCSRANFQGNRQYRAHRRGAFFVEAKVAVGITLAPKKLILTRRASFDVALFSTDFITRPGIPWGNCFG